MHFKTFAVAALASAVTAQQSLTQALNSYAQLSTLTTLISSFPDLVGQLNNASNITSLAPSNGAISTLLSSSVGAQAASNPSLIQALLTYHVLNGNYSSFSNTSSFISTQLLPPTFANVTGGQRVEGIGSDINGTVISGLKSRSNASAPISFTGSSIHIIDRVLTLPSNISSTAVAFNLTAAAGALTRTNFINAVDTTADLTVFVPNNAAFQNIGSALPSFTTQQIASILQYHVVAGVIGYSTLLRNESLTTLQGNNLTVTAGRSGIFVNSACVLISNVLVANGVVRVIDNVLNPNSTATANTTATAGSPAFSDASSVSSVRLTSGVQGPTRNIDISSIVASASATVAQSSSSSSAGAWMPRATGLGAALIADGVTVLAL